MRIVLIWLWLSKIFTEKFIDWKFLFYFIFVRIIIVYIIYKCEMIFLVTANFRNNTVQDRFQ